MKTGIELIAEERQRQVSAEGWTPEHDDKHTNLQLNEAASSYLYAARMVLRTPVKHPSEPKDWPWDAEWWKPSENPIRNLIKAGALIAAEIDRLQRKAEE